MANAEAQQKNRVQEARAARVLTEPGTDFVTTKIRHSSMGVCSRRFPSESKVASVYDWAGSLSPDITDVTLHDPLEKLLSHSAQLEDRCTITTATDV